MARRSSHRFSSQLSGWRTRIAGSKAAKLVPFPHVRNDVLQSACRGPAGAPLENQDWHNGRRERLTVDRVAYRVRAGHVLHDSRPLGSGAHLAAVNGYRSSGGGGEEGSRHDIRDHFAGRLNETCEIQVFSFCYSGPLDGLPPAPRAPPPASRIHGSSSTTVGLDRL